MTTESFSQVQNSVPGTLHVIETVIPVVRMIRTYHRRWLHAHVVAGVTIVAMLIQQG
jgi:hypothetical protein